MQHRLTLTDRDPAQPDLTLRPLTDADAEPLMALATAHAAEYAQMGTLPTTPKFYSSALGAPDQWPFVMLLDGAYAGSTRYMEMRPNHHRLEIGATWLAPAHQRSGVNRRAKRLLLQHAFEVLEMRRVELKTDLLNTRSQAAIERLGAVKEGVLRQHMPRPDGSQRDTVMYSVIAAEWPALRARLEEPRR